MSVERIIGIDFGTSTSVIRVKRYENGKPLGERFDSKPVVFNMGSTMVPTLIRKSGEDTVYGFNAEVAKRSSMLYQNFKVFLESDNADQKEKARELTADFLRYLAKVYREQSVGGHFGDPSDEEKTIISYPVKWSEETKRFMVEAAKEAGFPNVKGMDEANAAIRAITLQNEELLKSMGYLRENEPLNIMLLDMGAGTTDLVLCRYTPGKVNSCEILCTYPDKGNILFGGREVDELLGKYISERVPEEFRSTIMKKLGQENYKIWKETMVSPSLNKHEKVEEFSALDTLADVLEFEVDFQLDRAAFEECSKDYLKGLPDLINGCLTSANLSGEDIDLAILTGGHSQWYFVKDILSGKNQAFGACGLNKIVADEKRIITIPRPQETVALGLVFSNMSVSVIKKPQETSPATNIEETLNREKKENSTETEKVIEISPSTAQGFLLPIEDVFTITGRGTVVTGKIERGSVKVGDTVEIIGSNDYKKITVICSIQINKHSVNEAAIGDNVGLLLEGISRKEIKRGAVVCTIGLAFDKTKYDNELKKQLNECWNRLLLDLSDLLKLNGNPCTVNDQTKIRATKLIELANTRIKSEIQLEDILLFSDKYDHYYSMGIKPWEKFYWDLKEYNKEHALDSRFLFTKKGLIRFHTETSYLFLDFGRTDYLTVEEFPIQKLSVKVSEDKILVCKKDATVQSISTLLASNSRPLTEIQKDWDLLLSYLKRL